MKFDLSDFLELDTKALLAVNGGSDCSTSYSGPSSDDSGSSGNGPGSSTTTSGSKSGGGYCSGASDGKTVYKNPYYKNPGDKGTTTVSGGGTCGNVLSDDGESSDEGNSSDIAKVGDGIAYPLGDEYSDDFVVTDTFGPRDAIETPNGTTGKFHTGIDIAAPEGTRINSIGDGVVSEVGNNDSLGNYVVVTHPNGTHTRYAHCSEITAGVGTIVSAGQQIGCVGATGMATGSHLHLSYDGDGDGYYTNSESDNPNYLLSR